MQVSELIISSPLNFHVFCIQNLENINFPPQTYNACMQVPITKYIRAHIIVYLFGVDIRQVLLFLLLKYGIFIISVNKIHDKL